MASDDFKTPRGDVFNAGVDSVVSNRAPLNVLVVDDSKALRLRVVTCLSGASDVGTVWQAGDGEEALRVVLGHPVDMVLLDLQMPRMDGFSFLRILTSKHALPVVVLSSLSSAASVFQALELGAIDFIPKSPSFSRGENERLCQVIREKIRMVRALRRVESSRLAASKSRPDLSAEAARASSLFDEPVPSSTRFCALDRFGGREPSSNFSRHPAFIVAIAASTGGPLALLDVLERLPLDSKKAIVVAVHMPPKFTEAFAHRLNKQTEWDVLEARGTRELVGGQVLIAPGGKNMQVTQEPGARRWMVRVTSVEPDQVYIPSADVLFSTSARVAGSRVVAVVLSGMGDDGALGAGEVASAGGLVIVQTPSTAVLDSMPRAALARVSSARVLPTAAIAAALQTLR